MGDMKHVFLNCREHLFRAGENMITFSGQVFENMITLLIKVTALLLTATLSLYLWGYKIPLAPGLPTVLIPANLIFSFLVGHPICIGVVIGY